MMNNFVNKTTYYQHKMYRWKSYMKEQSLRIARRHNSKIVGNSKLVCALMRCSKNKKTLSLSEFSKFLKFNFISVPKEIYKLVHLWFCRKNKNYCYIDDVRKKLLPDRFEMKGSFLDFPSLSNNNYNKNDVKEFIKKLKKYVIVKFHNFKEFFRELDYNDNRMIEKSEFIKWCRHNNICVHFSVSRFVNIVNEIFEKSHHNSLTYKDLSLFMGNEFKKKIINVEKKHNSRTKKQRKRRIKILNKTSLYKRNKKLFR